ncbi:MAG: FecR family protein [Planctomycetota bacterium]
MNQRPMDPKAHIQDYLDGELTQQQFAELSAWLAEDEANREAFIQATMFDTQLHRELTQSDLNRFMRDVDLHAMRETGGEGNDGSALSMLDAPSFILEEKDEQPVTLGKLFSLAGYFAAKQLRAKAVQIGSIAALLVMALVLYAVFVGPGDDRTAPETAGMQPDEPASIQATGPPVNPLPSPTVATLTADYGASWQTASGGIAPGVGDGLKPGRQLSLADGAVQLTTRSGAVVTLQGPAEVRVHAQSRVELVQGRLLARCETPESKGFTVFTDTAEVTDIGTVFAVERDGQGRTITGVLDGHVALSYKLNNDGPRLLKAGDVAAVSAQGLALTEPPTEVSQRFDDWGKLLRPVKVTGEAVLVDTMPERLSEDDAMVRVYREALGKLLQDDMIVSRTEPGLYRPIDGNQKTALPAGTRVDSYLVHLDRPRSPTDILTKRFTITFEQPVAALVVHRQMLLATDKNFGAPGMQNSKAGGRGLVTLRGFGPDNPQLDSIRWSDDRKTLDVTLNVQNHDQFRVLTLSPEAALAEGNRE